MKISGLKMHFGNNGQAFVDVWCECRTQDDCDQMIAWLQMAKANMKQWGKISAEASRTAKAAAGKDETQKQG